MPESTAEFLARIERISEREYISYASALTSELPLFVEKLTAAPPPTLHRRPTTTRTDGEAPPINVPLVFMYVGGDYALGLYHGGTVPDNILGWVALRDLAFRAIPHTVPTLGEWTLETIPQPGTRFEAYTVLGGVVHYKPFISPEEWEVEFNRLNVVAWRELPPLPSAAELNA